jgi:hypothetical protein
MHSEAKVIWIPFPPAIIISRDYMKDCGVGKSTFPEKLRYSRILAKNLAQNLAQLTHDVLYGSQL